MRKFLKTIALTATAVAALIGLQTTAFADEVGTLPSFPVTTAKVYQYTYRTDSITFYNLANVEQDETAYNITIYNKMLLGADLEEGTLLRDVFFVFNGQGGFDTVTFPKELAAESRSRFKPAYPLDTFALMSPQSYFAGKPMKGFAVAAIGGLLFTDSLPEEADQDGNFVPLVNCQDASLLRSPLTQNCVRYFPIQNNDQNSIIQPKKGQTAPVVLSYGLTNEGEGVILTQFEYLVSDSTWRIQILYYLSSCKTEFIIGHFGINAGAETPTADKSFFIVPAVVKNGRSASDFMAFGKGMDKVGIGVGHLPCWSILTTIDSVGKKGIPANGPHRAKIGRRISVVPPVDSTAFSVQGFKAYPNRLEGWGVLDPRKSSMASYENIRSLLILASDQTPEQNIIDPPVFINKASRYKPGDKVSTKTTRNAYTVMFDTMPTHFNKLDSVPLGKGRLKQNTNHYLYVYMGDTNAYTQTSYFYHPHRTAHFGPHRTLSVGAVKNFVVSDIIKDSIVLSVEIEDETDHTILLGSLNVNAIDPNDLTNNLHNLPNARVVAFLDPGVKTTSLFMPPGEGGYLHCYAAKIIDQDTFYTEKSFTKTVYRAGNKLPLLWEFNAHDIYAGTWSNDVEPLLPYGWHHNAYEASKTAEAYFFAQKAPDNTTQLCLTAPTDHYTASLYAPIFVSDQNKVQATFEVSYNLNNTLYTPVNGQDSVLIEYRLNHGDWQTALAKGSFAQPTGNGRWLITTGFDCQAGDTVTLRYTARISKQNVTHGIVSLYLEKGRICQPPVNLTVNDNRATSQSVNLSWTNPNTGDYSVAYRVYHQEAKTDLFYSWENTRARINSTVLTDLKPFTTYRVYVKAVCSADTSMFSDFVLASTLYGLPFSDQLNKVYANPTNPQSKVLETPKDRGFKTYAGKMGGVWEELEDKNLTWSNASSFSAFASQCERGMAVGEHVGEGILVTPGVYAENETKLSFTLSSFKLESVVDNVKQMAYGAVPSDPGCKLRVAVSNTGTFENSDVVLTLTGNALNLKDSVFNITTQKTGHLQVGFFFENPTIKWQDAFYLELSKMAFTEEEEVVSHKLSLVVAPDTAWGKVTGEGTYQRGTEVTISAEPNPGYFFVAWHEGDKELSQSSSFTFPMPGEDKTYTAIFQVDTESEYEVTLGSSPVEGGSTMGSGFYKIGAPVVMAARPNRGYEFVAWVDGNNATDTISRYISRSFYMPPQHVNYIALFRSLTSNEEFSLRASFSLSAENGMLHIRNLDGVQVKNVDVYGLNGACLHRFAPGSGEDLSLPIDADRALIFVRLDTEKGVVVYKVYMQ